jgi:hypothetical protein
LPHLWPTGSSSGWPPSITARYFSSCPSDSTSRWTPCPPETYEDWLQVRLGCVRLSLSCPFRFLHTFLPLPGQRGITPAFGYSAPHSSAGGTSTLPINALLSAHYNAIRLLTAVHAGRAAFAFSGRTGALLAQPTMRSPGSRACSFSACAGSTTTRDHPPARVCAGGCAAFPICPQGRRPGLGFRSSIPSPLIPRVYASTRASRRAPQDWRPGGSLFLSCRTLSFPTACRFIPALGQYPQFRFSGAIWRGPIRTVDTMNDAR